MLERLFIPDRNGDDVPDGPPEVVLDGWSLKCKHNVFNALTWGPDGWLYGLNGITDTSHVGRPGTPADERIALNCGVWRYHPIRHTFEVVANGTTNPWGLDYDDYGQMFITNCVIEHLWHVVPGAHFKRMFGQDFNPHLYRLLETCADHIHWGGGAWQSSRGGVGVHDKPGGGHAHTGCMVYLGDNWPSQYRGGVFMCNIHGNRVNHDTLERKGSGYLAKHAADFLYANDTWFRGLSLQYGPDGGVFVSDWCDTGECHDYDDIHRENGRIFKVTHGKPTPWHGDLAKLSDAELVRLQLHKNDWFVRHARRLLQERAVAGKVNADARSELLTMLRQQTDTPKRLRALWALHAVGAVDEKLITELLDSPDEYLRAWAIILELEDRDASSAILTRLAQMAAKDPSPFVRLYLASGLQRLPAAKRWAIAEALVRHGEDASDAYLPLMIWYGIEPLVDADPERFLMLIGKARIPLIREYISRRLALADSLKNTVREAGQLDTASQADILRGMYDALNGRRQVPMPAEWPAVYRKLVQSPNAEVRDKAQLLAVLFGDADAMTAMRQTLQDAKAVPAARQSALQALLSKRSPDLLPVLQNLLDDKALRGPSLRALAAYTDDATPGRILKLYPTLTDDEKADAIQTLASRPAYALALLDAVEKGQVQRRDLSAFTVRQIQALKSKPVNDRLTQVWGTIRPASQEKASLLAKYKGLLTPEYIKTAEPSQGRLIFAKTCANCHTLFGEGGKIGPELTGAQRNNLDYLLENLIDPSALVGRDYQVTQIETQNGRTITGIIKEETDQVLTLQTQNELLRVPKADIAGRVLSPLSMMPERLLDNLKDEEVRDLIAYLGSPAQVPVPGGNEEKPKPK